MVKLSKKRRKLNTSSSDKIFDTVNVILMVILLIILAWPLYFVLIASLSNPSEVWNGNVIFWPKGFTLNGYTELFKYKKLWIGYRNTIFYTALGTVINMVMTVLCAYPLSRKDWMPRNFFMKLCLITMYVNGGLIPTYLVVNKLHMINTVWSMIIPSALSFYNALIVRSYFMGSIPESLQEAAELDGANSVQYLLSIVLPLSKPVLAVVGLYYAVGHWNDYYTALIYIYDSSLSPLQSVLREILASVTTIATQTNMSAQDAIAMAEKIQLGQTLKYTSIIVSVIPMLLVYPLVQKYFVKGTMIGAIKG